jgi:hypothetical protein
MDSPISRMIRARMFLAAALFIGCADRPSNDIPISCPTKLPPDGSTCSGTAVCSYESQCGAQSWARCETGRWVVTQAVPTDASCR